MVQAEVQQADRRSGGAAKAKVAVVYTRPETVFEDIARAMRLADYQSHLTTDVSTLLKINISWQHYYPACSTTPWQLEGVIKTLLEDGHKDLIAAHNGTVVVDSFEGEISNKQRPVQEKYNLPNVHLDVAPNRWIPYQPKAEMMVLDKIFPEGLTIPEIFPGKNVVHLPTMKTHVFTTMTGAMKNAFGGLLSRKRHWTHSVIHETLVDCWLSRRRFTPASLP